MAEISVIVPVYQVEQYLRQCLDSILKQTFTDFELILVDDGSKDNSGKICDEYALKDNRVRVIHTTNIRAAGARNIGLDNVTGNYFMFVDSDDYISELMVEKLYEKFPDVDALAAAEPEEIEEIVRPCGLGRSKDDEERIGIRDHRKIKRNVS